MDDAFTLWSLYYLIFVLWSLYYLIFVLWSLYYLMDDAFTLWSLYYLIHDWLTITTPPLHLLGITGIGNNGNGKMATEEMVPEKRQLEKITICKFRKKRHPIYLFCIVA